MNQYNGSPCVSDFAAEVKIFDSLEEDVDAIDDVKDIGSIELDFGQFFYTCFLTSSTNQC